MVTTLRFLLCAILMYGCSAPLHYGTSARLRGRTEVVLLGAIHREHLEHRRYSLSVLKQIITEVSPSTILVEVPPILFESEYDQWQRSNVGPWLEQFPEVSGAILPLARQEGIVVEPVSGLTDEIAERRKQYRKVFPEGPAERRYQNVARQVKRELHRSTHDANPVFINGKDYRRLTAWEQRTFATYDHELGEAGVRELLLRHWTLINEAIDKHQGERILLVFAAQDIWFFEQMIKERSDATLIDVRVFVERVDQRVRKIEAERRRQRRRD